jgi:hypothetical protein
MNKVATIALYVQKFLDSVKTSSTKTSNPKAVAKGEEQN